MTQEFDRELRKCIADVRREAKATQIDRAVENNFRDVDRELRY